MSVGGVTNGIYTTDSAKQVEYIVNDSGTRFFFVENEEQLDKMLEVRARCPDSSRSSSMTWKGCTASSDDQVMTFDELPQLGADYERSIPRPCDAHRRGLRSPRIWRMLVYTSGTTGPPKGAMLCHRNVLFQLDNADFICRAARGRRAAFLPAALPHRRADVHASSIRSTGAVVNFAESIDTVPENVARGRPDAVLRGARGSGRSSIPTSRIRMPDATWHRNGFAYDAAIPSAGRWPPHASRDAGRSRGSERSRSGSPTSSCFDNIKIYLGLHRARIVGTGAAPISPDLISWYLALGLDMREIYGQTENTGLSTAMPRNASSSAR